MKVFSSGSAWFLAFIVANPSEAAASSSRSPRGWRMLASSVVFQALGPEKKVLQCLRTSLIWGQGWVTGSAYLA